MTKIAQLQFNREMGIEPTDSQLERLLADNAELLAFIEASEKEFSLSNGKTISALTRGQAEIKLAQLKVQKKFGQSVELSPTYSESTAETHDMRA